MNLLTRDRFARARHVPAAHSTAVVVDVRHAGGAIAQCLAQHGFAVALGHAPRDADEAARAVSAIAAGGGCALAVELARGGETAVTRLFDRAEEVFGHVDVLVDNGRGHVAARSTEDELFDRYFGVALRGMVDRVREAAPRLRSGGSIVRLCASATGETPKTQAWMTPHAALEWLTRTFAAELVRYDIRINAIAPSSRCDEPAIAEAVGLLLGADGEGCNGQVFDVGAAALRAIGASA